MNTKNNKRKRESIEKIEKIFISLLQEKEISKISVSDICTGAVLNRSTFYANYLDIYDLRDKVKDRLEKEFLSLYSEEVAQKSSSYNFLKLFHHIRDNQLFYKTYMKLSTDSDAIIGYDKESAEKFFNSEFIDYHIEFFKSGLNAILRKWINSGCKETPEVIESILKSEYLRKF